MNTTLLSPLFTSRTTASVNVSQLKSQKTVEGEVGEGEVGEGRGTASQG